MAKKRNFSTDVDQDSPLTAILPRENIHRRTPALTEIKRLNEALRESEELRFGIVDNDPNPIVVHDPNLSIIYVNRALEELTGYRLADVAGQVPPHPWWTKETRIKSKEELHARLKRTKNRVEEIFQSRDGRKIYVEVNSRPVKHRGKIKYLLSSWIDVTERELSAKALKESERFSSSLLKYSPNPILVFNSDASIRYVNPSLEELTGFKAGELVGQKPPYSWWIEENREKDTREFLSQLHSGSRKTEKLIQNKRGERIWIQITSAPIMLDGEFVYGISNWVDITEIKNAESKLKKLTEELRTLSAHSESVRESERSRIAREIHDELGQALASLKMDVRWMDDNLNDNIEYCHDLTKSMAKTIDLTVQKIKQICIELRPKLLDDIGLPGTINWILSEFERTTGIECNYKCYLKETVIGGEKATAVYRIFMEALTNIYRHAQAQKVTVNLRKSETELILKIQDNGKGISEEQIMSPRSLGIMGMRERVLFWGGTLNIQGVSGKSTSLIIKIPLGTRGEKQ